ncbi:FAD-dependent oxidoreductase [Patulibacter minatonensis]|uniref:FAD-dependent oxidoreductase n=1 Tax=Patulibacter minatonensis TaxID=298163 RepID=UPI001FE0D492|nr:FAD-dependent oxidoreductase [Patulibacter minatonensis]
MSAAQSPPRRPAIVVVDDEPAVLAAVSRDLRRGFGERFRIVRAGSGPEALQLIRDLRTRGDQVALLVADQRMPGMSGTEYLVEARKLVPDAKRVLLTAYADTEAAISAINEVALDYYLLKPWDPPEEQLFPVVEDLLTTWESGAALEQGGVRVIGHRFSKASHDLRDFLARNRVPARWLDVERDSEARELLEVIGASQDCLPVALLEDGGVMEKPTILELAERLGVSSAPTEDHYDLVIVGGGPAGLAAAVYGASEGLKTVLVEREAPGGQAGQSSRIENYLGFPAGLSGSDLARRGTDQARRLGAELLTVSDAVALRVEGAGRFLELGSGATLSATCVVVASGVSYRQLDAPGFAEHTGAGIYYGAALTEARACSNQHVVVIGGANSAGQAAVHFSGYARQVTMLVRGPNLERSMSHYLIEQLAALPNVEVRTCTSVVSAEGEDGHLARLTVRTTPNGTSGPAGGPPAEPVAVGADGAASASADPVGGGPDVGAEDGTATGGGGTATVIEETMDVDACFVFIGAQPRTDWLDGVVARDERGFILAGADAQEAGWSLSRDPYLLESSVPGVFVAGDVRARSIKRVASAVGEGSMSVSLVHQYLAEG